MRFTVGTERRGDRTIYTLGDESTGASAAILPSYGFNLFDLNLPAGGRPRSIVATDPGWEAHPEYPARQGFPVLFPFPNRIRDGRFSFAGRDYQLDLTKPPNAIHGFALDAHWDVVDHGTDPHGAHIVGRYRIGKQSPRQAHHWPADAILELKYTLAGRTLTLDAIVTNPSDAELPYGLGFHPYFRLPMNAGGDLGQTRVVLPTGKFWALQDTLPTGQIRPVPFPADFRRGRSMAGLVADDVYTGIEYDETGHAACRLIDEALGAEFRLTIDRNYREIVVFTPPGKPGVIAVEPYTQTTDAINLHARGVDGGLRVLEPGASEALHLRMETIDD